MFKKLLQFFGFMKDDPKCAECSATMCQCADVYPTVVATPVAKVYKEEKSAPTLPAEAPVYDMKRMEEALASPSIDIPQGLTKDEIREVILDVAKPKKAKKPAAPKAPVDPNKPKKKRAPRKKKTA